MIRILVVCAALSGILSGCSDSMASASGEGVSKQAKCEAIVAHENQRSGRDMMSDDIMASFVSNDLVTTCRQTAGPIVAHLHLRYGL